MNSTGNDNAFFGRAAGGLNTNGGTNSFFGARAGDANTIGDNNTIIGANADVGSNNLTYATAIGADAVVNTSNLIVLGRPSGTDSVAIPGVLNTTGIINTSAQYNIANNRVLSIAGTDNIFVGIGTGANNTGNRNSFVGRNAGFANTFSTDNSFFGFEAGKNSVGDSVFNEGGNSFFGSRAGVTNTTGRDNAFFGAGAGHDNTSGGANSFFGVAAGFSNMTGGTNSFFGNGAGLSNTTGDNNTFIGATNIFSGHNTTGDDNTTIGYGADVDFNNLTHATAIGAGATVGSSNTIVLGRSDGSDTVIVPGKLKIDTLGTAGATPLCLNGSNRVGTCSALSSTGNTTELQSRIDAQQKLIEAQQKQIEALTRLVCQQSPQAEICKEEKPR